VGGIVGNRAIESAAIQWIIKLEEAAGRAALDTRGGGGVADITSPPRTIEVKASGGVARGQDLWLERPRSTRRLPTRLLGVRS
jgi:hypothetical protein